nr:unnamed protein product [Spirometra erinaceieuropaei]
MSPAPIAAYKDATNQDDAETERINPYLWVLDGLVSSITKTAYRKPEKSSIQLRIYMMRWLKTNLQKLRKKYKKYNGDRKGDTKTLSPSLRSGDPSSSGSAAKLHYATPQAVPNFIPHTLYANEQNAGCQSDFFPVKGSRCFQREDLMDLDVIRSHHLHNHLARRISQPHIGTAVQVSINVENKVRPVVTNFHRTFTNAFCTMQTDDLNGLPEDGQRAEAAVVLVDRAKRHRACKNRSPANVGLIICVESEKQQQQQQQQQQEQQQGRPRWRWWSHRGELLIGLGLLVSLAKPTENALLVASASHKSGCGKYAGDEEASAKQ